MHINFRLCSACTHTSHIASSWVKPLISDRNAAGWRWARRECHRRDCETEMDAELTAGGMVFGVFLFPFFPFSLEICEDMGEMSARGTGEVSA